MSRGGSKISRDGNYEYERGGNVPDWLSNFAKKYEQAEKTAVEVSRERNSEPSVFERMNAIMNGHSSGKISPYSTVDEAVKDYQKRTGLAAFQEKIEENKKRAIAQQILDASEDEDEKKNFVRPKILDENPTIDHYISNVIDTQYGIQLPAILQSILETFSRQVSEPELDDPDLAQYIVKLIDSRRSRKEDVHEANIGRGVGTEKIYYDINDSNKDPFSCLMPRRIY